MQVKTRCNLGLKILGYFKIILTISLFPLMVNAGNIKLGQSMSDTESRINEQLLVQIKAVVQKQHKTPINHFEIVQIEDKNWPNSALGCPKAGMQYMQMITPGYLVKVKADGMSYKVHTSSTHAVLCAKNKPDSLSNRTHKKPKIEESTLNRVKAIQLARSMLIKTKDIEKRSVRLKSVSDANISDFNQNCKSNYFGKSKGYRVVLTHLKTEIIYFSDGKEVVKCSSHTRVKS